MTISQVVQSGLFATEDQQLVRIPIRADEGVQSKRRRARRQKEMKARSKRSLLLWSTEEHERFLEALELYPSGPWKVIAEHVGTRTTRQTMTHAQKYRQKIERRRQKQLQSSMNPGAGGALSQPQSTAVCAEATSMPLAVEPNNTTADNDSEHAILLEFLDSFQPSEIDPTEPLPHTRDRCFVLDVKAASTCPTSSS